MIIFDATEFWGKPNPALPAGQEPKPNRDVDVHLRMPDMERAYLFSHHHILGSKEQSPEPNLPHLDRHLALLPRGAHVVINLEGEPWVVRPTQSPAEFAAVLVRYTRLLRHMRMRRPDCSFGIYLIFPFRQEDARKRDESWRRMNAATRGWGDTDPVSLCQFISPEFYAFGPSEAVMHAHMADNGAEARKYNRIVRPMLWPFYHPQAPAELRYRPIPMPLWRSMLRFCLDEGYEPIIYGANGVRFDERWDWYQVLKEFLPQ